MKVSLVGFAGPMGCGKSTAIEELRKEAGLHGRPVVLVKFAQPLYDIQEYIYQRISSVILRGTGFTKDRKLLQWIGTEWGRGMDESLWIKLWAKEVDRIQNEYRDPIIVCDDVRFDNEAEMFKNLGGVIIQIRTTRNGERIDTKAGIANHASEAGVSARFISQVVDNNDTLRQYQERLAGIFRELNLS
jgi:hypothetical protein